MSVYGPFASTSSTPALTSARAVLEEGGGSYSVCVAWGSDDGTETHSGWEISIGVTGYYKGNVNGGAAFAVDGTTTKTVSASSCYSHKDSRGRHVWAYPLASVIPSYISASATYGNRKYDALNLTATVTELATGSRYSNTATIYVKYKPLYELTAFRYVSADTAVIEYSTTWLRDDDRFTLYKESTVKRANGIAVQLSAQQNGAVASFDASSGTGVIALDASKFKRVAIGLDCWLKVGFTTMAGSSYFAGTTSATLTCEDASKCDAPKLYVSVDDLTAVVEAEPDGSTGYEYDVATVTLAGGDLPGDTVELDYAAGETVARFPYVPLGTEVTFQAIGSRDPGTGGADIVSAVTEYSLTVDSDGQRVLDCVESGGRATLEYRPKDEGHAPQVSLSPGMDMVQLAGRARPSAYPTGSSTASVDFNGYVLGDGDAGFRDVAEGGLCVLRTPGGGRWPVVVGTVKTEHRTGDYTEISVSCEEVDWQ